MRTAIILVCLMSATAIAQQRINIKIDKRLLESDEKQEQRRRYYQDVDDAARSESAADIKKERANEARLLKSVLNYAKAKHWPQQPAVKLEPNGHTMEMYAGDFIVKLKMKTCDAGLLEKFGAWLIKSKVGKFSIIKMSPHGYPITGWPEQLCGVGCWDDEDKPRVAVYLCEEKRKDEWSATPLASEPRLVVVPQEDEHAAPATTPDKASEPTTPEQKPQP